MSDASALLADLSDEAVLRLEQVCSRFESSWQAGTQPPLDDFLGDADGPERLALLRELLLLEAYYRRRIGEHPSSTDYQDRYPEAALIVEEVFADSPEQIAPQPLLETVDEIGHAAPQDQQTTDEGPTNGNGSLQGVDSPGAASAGRFRPVRFHAAGALGEVYVALDTELRREVALKEIRKAQAGHEEGRSRFVLEAETTGRLEHPGIVPVYGLGAYPDGRPYYAMRFIQGESLKAAIDRFHAPSSARFDSLEFRQLLGRFVAVCQAVAYAHSRGVLHRDLKPDNIMLGQFGETLVVDWGLAKVMGREDEKPALGASIPAAAHGETALGRVMGTPAYMSPEQAAGRVKDLGPATDVYSLGATFYALLTNQPPFMGKIAEVLSQVQQGSWKPARSVNEMVPPALDSICRKAMALGADDRYNSAQALAEDVEHWLADEPVSAYAEPVGARLRRWMRKRPRRVTAALVLLLTAVVGLTLGTVLLDVQKREAEDNLAMVQEQAKFFAQEVSEGALLNEPGMQDVRQRILLEALKTYDGFLKKRPKDPNARRLMAGATRQLGELYLQTPQGMVDASAYAKRAVRVYEELLGENPADREARIGLARARYLLSDVQVQSGEVGEGKKEVDRSIELLQGLVEQAPGDGDYLHALARSYAHRAWIERLEGRVEPGLADNQRVLVILVDRAPSLPKRIYTNGPAESSVFSRRPMSHRTDFGGVGWESILWPLRLLLGRACINQGLLLNMAGQDGEACRALERAIVVLRRLVEEYRRPGQFHHGLALALVHFGRFKVQLGQPRSAEPALREALDLMQRLVQDDPYADEYAATRVLAAGCLGESLFRQGRTAEAVELLRQVETQGEKVLAGTRRDHGLRGQYAHLLHVLGCLECERGHPDRGLFICRIAHEKLEQTLRDTPGDRSLQSDWLTNREALARCRFLTGDLSRDGWIAEQQEIVQKRKALVGQGQLSPRFSGDIAGSAVNLARLLLEANRPVEALDRIDALLPDHEKAVRAEQARVNAAVKQQKEEEAHQVPVSPYQNLLQSFLQQAPIASDRSLQSQWATLLARRGAALACLGRNMEAAESVRQGIAITAGIVCADRPFPPPPTSVALLCGSLPTLLWQPEPGDFYDLACHLTLASSIPAGKGKPNAADHAMWSLQSSVAAGFDNLHRIRTDPALEPLRKREDFQQLVHDLEARSPRRKEAAVNP